MPQQAAGTADRRGGRLQRFAGRAVAQDLRARRFAAAVGYTGAELAKEAPYYAGAFGAVLYTDTVSANDAIVFLGGANLGAQVYEYGLARLVRAFLKFAPRTDGIKHAAIETTRDSECLR